MEKDNKEKMLGIVAFLIIICVVLSGVFIYENMSKSSAVDKHIGGFYCMESEKYLMGGDYYTSEYIEGSSPMMTITKYSNDLICGNIDGAAFCG